MAPKAKPKAKAKATAQSGATTKERRQLNRRDSDDKVDRVVERHFSHLPPQVLENKTVNGKRIRELVKEDIKACKGAKTRLGKTYWQNVAVQYSEGTSSIDKIAPMDGDVRDSLVTALTFLLHENPTHRKPEKFCTYIKELKEELTESELCGLITSTLSSRQTVRDGWDPVVLAVMEYFNTFSVKAKYPSYFQACVALFDRVAARAYSELHKSNCSWGTFLETHEFVPLLLFDVADMAIVSANVKELAAAMPAMCRLHQSSYTAKLIFGPLIDDVNVKTFSANVDEELKALNEGVIGVSQLNAVKAIHLHTTSSQHFCFSIVA
jgi:hypothetical protein